MIELDETKSESWNIFNELDDIIKMFYDEKEALETRHANNSLDKVVSVNDLERLCHIKKRYKKVTSKKKKQDCDSEFCLIFPCDKENGFADTILCQNGCKLQDVRKL